MAVITGITGSVTSWAGSGFNASLLTGGRANQFSLNMDMDNLDTTAFADAGVSTAIRGPSSWSGSWTAYLATPQNGSLGSVAGTGLYVSNLNAWTLNCTQQAIESTAFSATTKAFIPGAIKWGGTYSGYQDDTTVVVAAGLPASNASATFTYFTSYTLVGTIFTTQLGLNSSPNAAGTVSYSYQGTGSLTGAGSVPIFTAGAVPVATTPTDITLTASTGQTFVGSAFWTSIALSVGVNQATMLTVGFQGTGALAIT